jgi:hypothetical protein
MSDDDKFAIHIWRRVIESGHIFHEGVEAMKRTLYATAVFFAISFCIYAMLSAGAADKTALFYTAKPENVPEWAKQGNFQFIRIDGGGIETMKAERTQWGREFSDKDKEVLTNIYTKYSDKLFSRLKEAGFNWIWVTWSNGWSYADEKSARAELKNFIKRAHGEGFKVTTYLSAVNMFWESTFKDEPETLPWTLIENGKPVMYGGPLNPMRFIADARIQGWRDYILKKAGDAIDAGADAVFFDNVLGDKDGLKTLFSQFQIMAEKKAKKKGTPKVLLYVNAHLKPDRMDIHDIDEIIWIELGQSTPGVWPDDGFDVTNARRIRFLNGAKYQWQPTKYENNQYHCGPREKCIPTPVEQKLSIAEAWAFGSSTSRNIEGRFLGALMTDEKEALDAWAAIGEYNNWINAYKDIYTDAIPVARIALLAIHDCVGYSSLADHAMAEMLIRRNVMFGTKVTTRMARGFPLGQYKTLLIPDVVAEISPEEAAEIDKYSSSGAKVFAKKPSDDQLKLPGVAEFYGNLNYTPIPREVTDTISKNQSPAEFFSDVEKSAGGPLITIENEGYIVSNVMKKRNENVFFVHLINYDFNKHGDGVKVSLDLGDYLKDLAGYTVKILSPDGGGEKPADIGIKGTKIVFTVKSVEHYSVAVIAPELVWDRLELEMK